MAIKKWYRSRSDRWLGGVCGGLGEYLSVDANLIRLLWLLLCFGGGAGVVLYVVAWLILPEAPRSKR
jgi:phage shock protein PspC (stress-responsive transcriptional regulator)